MRCPLHFGLGICDFFRDSKEHAFFFLFDDVLCCVAYNTKSSVVGGSDY
jgi:hypothetical protein